MQPQSAQPGLCPHRGQPHSHTLPGPQISDSSHFPSTPVPSAPSHWPPSYPAPTGVNVFGKPPDPFTLVMGGNFLAMAEQETPAFRGALMPDLESYRRLIRESMSQLVHEAADGGDANTLMTTVTAAAVALIRGAECADAMLIDGQSFQSLAPTAPCNTELDAVQMRYGRGPCMEAAVDDAVVRSPDLATEPRWPEFTRAARAAGVRSVLTFQLHAPEHHAGALNIYGCAAGSFNVEDEAIGATLATYASIMLVTQMKAAKLDGMLADREIVGRATGILMERLQIGAERAFEQLVERSRSNGTSIRSVADAIAYTTESATDTTHVHGGGGGGGGGI